MAKASSIPRIACTILFEAPESKVYVRRYVIDSLADTGILIHQHDSTWLARDFFEFWEAMKRLEH
jgi:hypothetical protein